MLAIGVRELRQRASELLRRVEAGETIEVTDRGRPVALLTPVPRATGLERLRVEGDTTAASDDLDTLPAPIAAPPTGPLPSRVLERLRPDER